MAQDKIGHALALYSLLNEELGEDIPDKIAFNRTNKEFRCCHLVQYPFNEYDFALVRHFLFDQAQFLRFEDLKNSSNQRLQIIANKFIPELKYHIMHAEVWMRQLSNGNEESKFRIQNAINHLYSKSMGIFETYKGENILIENKIYKGETYLKTLWENNVNDLLLSCNLNIPDSINKNDGFGGRNFIHTEHLEPLLKEMTEVFMIDPIAEW